MIRLALFLTSYSTLCCHNLQGAKEAIQRTRFDPWFHVVSQVSPGAAPKHLPGIVPEYHWVRHTPPK